MMVLNRKEAVAYSVGRQLTLRTTSECIDQLMSQLQAARDEHKATVAAIRRELEEELDQLRKDLHEARRALARFQMIDALREWQPQTNRVN
jgi:hypothetical protein